MNRKKLRCHYRRLGSRAFAGTVMLAVVFAMIVQNSPAASADVFHGRWIKGRIEETYHRLGGFARFGNATTDELVSARDGRFQVFSVDTSAIYWHPQVDGGTAHEIRGRIRDRWADFGWEAGRLGYPLTDELTTPDGAGKFNHFENGSIYWSAATDAHQIEGEIFEKWGDLGYEAGRLGYPITDELTTPDGAGRFNHFSGGSIYWHPRNGAFEVTGSIREHWSENGWETGKYGYPTSGPYEVSGGVRQDFSGGSIQLAVPTGIALPKYDNAAYSSYRHIRPVVPIETYPRLNAAGLAREVMNNMVKYFPVSGCPNEIAVGAICTFRGIGGRVGTAVVDRIADTGFSLKTLPGHPEGEGRVLTVRFDAVSSPPLTSDKNAEILFDTDEIKSSYEGSDGTWLRLVIEAMGPSSQTQVAGPFSSDHIGRQVWPSMSQAVREGAPTSRVTYIQ
ncbi:LGFP repeat-containing protein [Corynebacterium sp. NPDC060344]|uniref:LGFP repeat-containing protein n=1 Tax=Corynebacterium sp. NPDC060344 TaxID=3347101 RepID=UPI0036637BB9